MPNIEGASLFHIDIPDSRLCKEITELVRDTESELLFNHSRRVYFFGALTGVRRGLRFNRELLYAAAMFHDVGLTDRYGSQTNRFEVDSANAARDFLKSARHAQAGPGGHYIGRDDCNIVPGDIDLVWTAIALHTTPGIPEHMHPVVALLTAGVEMDVMGIAYEKFPDADREAVVAAHPRTPRFKEDIIQAFYDGMKRRPETTFGTVNADVLADKDPTFKPYNFCSIIRGSHWQG